LRSWNAFVDHIAAIDITPQTRADVVMDLVPAKHDAIARHDLHTARLPLEIETMDVVFPDLIAFNQDIPALARDADLAVVMNVGASHAAACSDHDTGPLFHPHFAVLDNQPGLLPWIAPFSATLECFSTVAFLCQHVRRSTFEREGGLVTSILTPSDRRRNEPQPLA
jgi:hypothetical protein